MDDSQELMEFKQPPKKARFKHPVKEEKILELSKGIVPANTKKIPHERTKSSRTG